MNYKYKKPFKYHERTEKHFVSLLFKSLQGVE